MNAKEDSATRPIKLIATLEIAYLPKTVNQIGAKHWAVKHKIAAHCHALVMDQCLRKKIAGLNLDSAILELTRHSSREPDFDNMVGAWKYLIDGLVRAKVIKDDKPSVIGSPIFLWKKCPRKEAHVTIGIFTLVTIP